jgi:hypothetical protein
MRDGQYRTIVRGKEQERDPRGRERVSDGEGQFIAQVNVQDRRIRAICAYDLYGWSHRPQRPYHETAVLTQRCLHMYTEKRVVLDYQDAPFGKTGDFFDIRGGRSSELAKG